jgi:hypothetical protein
MKSYSKSKATLRRNEEAEARRVARNARTDEKQLELLKARGAGDCAEATKIRKRLAGLTSK